MQAKETPVNNSMTTARDELMERLRESNDIALATDLLRWDQTTYMPPGGAEARSRQIATLERIAHLRATDPQVGKLLETLQPYAQSLDYAADDAALIRVARRDYDLDVRIPADFAAECSAHFAQTYEVWATARPANDFAAVQPYLEKTLERSRRYAEFFPGYAHIADPLIARADYGVTVATLRPLFAELRAFLTPLVQTIAARPAPDNRFLYQQYPEQKQWDFGVDVIRAFGYDFHRGRQDKTHHPYMVKFSLGDVRITTRFQENDLAIGLFGTLHESGHAMYEQGIDLSYEATPLGGGASAGVHESQSRLWENLVGRSHVFWRFYYAPLQKVFSDQLGAIPLDAFYRAINRVEPSLIRTEADELTYNLHVIIRFEVELELLEGSLSIADLPEAWRSRYQQYLGVTPPDDRDGVLQDVHWYGDFIGGAFQGYTLGNILAAQFYAAALQAHPEIPDQIAAGEFATLHGWLREQIYRHGRKFTADELVQRVTGGPIQLQPYKDYLSKKYSDLYGL
jgi:carboxypeptidase Taq